MTSASSRGNDPLIMVPAEGDEKIIDAKVIRASIVSDDGPGEPVAHRQPQRAWVPETPMPGSEPHGSNQPGPAPAGSHEPAAEEPGSDEPSLEESSTDESGPGQPGPVESGPVESGPVESGPDAPRTVEAVSIPPASIAEASGPDEPATTPSEGPWPGIQSKFVDDPRRAVEQAAMVTSTALADLITAAKDREKALREDWKTDGAGTEELRVALRGYRDLTARITSLISDF